MSALLLSFAYFALGMGAGALLMFLIWKRSGPQMMAGAFKRLLKEQGYEIRDKRIVPTGESPTVHDQVADELAKILESM